ncbi:MAG: helix-turn-helix domain-containing protein [Clostridia bacterium]|nr:helix-turn-helix domain-containing protein [Clostridia bacterium]
MFDADLFCANLSTLRRNADMTQSELADKLNLTRQAVSRYEKGDSFPDISILVRIAEIFNISIDELIGAGAPTEGEQELLKNAALGRDVKSCRCNVRELENIAPFLKPSILDRAIQGFAEQGIDISNLASLFAYMSDSGFWELLGSSDFQRIDTVLLEKMIPFMNFSAKLSIFEKIIRGEIDWHFLSVLMKYIRISDTVLEAAVIDGVLDEGVLVLLREFHEKRSQSMKKCASCGEISPPETRFCLFCGARFPNENTAG